MTGSRLRRFLHAAIAGVERDVDWIEDALQEGEGHDRKVRVLAYAGYRNAHRLRLKGRIVRFRDPLTGAKGTIARLRAMMEIYNSHELPGIEVRLEGHGLDGRTPSDEEGYFDFDLPLELPLSDKTAWEHVRISTPGREAQAAEIKVPIMAPGLNQNWGIISDIDDTVIETGATDFLKNWRRVLIEKPEDRLAVPGAATLYRTIVADHQAPARPIFYVSSSPWNLYGFITEFMELNRIPHGPMFLKDYGIDSNQLIDSSHDEHKLAAIGTILAFYPDLKFLLIGDNGQRDVAIYARVVEEFGARIAAVFIRDVDGSCRTGPEGALLARIEAAGIPTFCGAGFDDAVAVVKTLDLERPLEAAKAISAPAEEE